MSNGSIRVKSSTIYTIEVNDKGEEISFDLADIGLQARLIECYQEIEVETSKYEKEEEKLLKLIESENSSADKEVKTELWYTENEKKLIFLEQNYYTTSRNIMDKFLGENACQKIFGESNFPTMFIELFEKLKPEFDKMGLSYKKMQKKLFNKYLPQNNRVLK